MKAFFPRLIIVPVLFCAAWLDPYRDAVSSGNAEYKEKNYHSAKRYYRKAERHAPSEREKKKLSFNTGDAEYMAEAHESALDEFRKALQADDRDVQKKALFNMGNAHLKMGNRREAIRAYIDALKIDPGYERAKKNLEFLLKNKDRQNEQKDGDGDKKDKDSGKNGDRDGASPRQEKGKDNTPKPGERRNPAGGMSRDQVMNLLRSLQQSQVRRQKGGGDERRKLEKSW